MDLDFPSAYAQQLSTAGMLFIVGWKKYYYHMLYSCSPWKHHRAADSSSISLARVRWCALHSCFVSTYAYVRQRLDQLLGRGLRNLSKRGSWGCEERRYCGILLSSSGRNVAWVRWKQLCEGQLSRVSHHSRWISRSSELA